LLENFVEFAVSGMEVRERCMRTPIFWIR
jgi:hypothetical protein